VGTAWWPTAETDMRPTSTAADCGAVGQAGVLTATLLSLLPHPHRAQLNPTRMGVPKRCASLNQQVDGFVREHGGDRPIYRCVQDMDGACTRAWCTMSVCWGTTLHVGSSPCQHSSTAGPKLHAGRAISHQPVTTASKASFCTQRSCLC
jgi:hypothetical protein